MELGWRTDKGDKNMKMAKLLLFKVYPFTLNMNSVSLEFAKIVFLIFYQFFHWQI